MRHSRRIKRMSRNRMKITKMNLTSLMDVFTILVFFLLVSSSEVQTLPNAKDLQSIVDYTRSPTATRLTPSPTASTRPAPS